MNTTTNIELIKSIIGRDDILPAFCGGVLPCDEEIMRGDIIYFYEPEVGLFPAEVIGHNRLLIHAAIPKRSRGKLAINAAKELANRLFSAGYEIFTVQKKIRHLKLFVLMVGFERIGSSSNRNYFIFRGAA